MAREQYAIGNHYVSTGDFIGNSGRITVAPPYVGDYPSTWITTTDQYPIDWSTLKIKLSAERSSMPDGTKPVVICGSVIEEAKDMDAAQAKAESLAHKHQSEAFILKPVRKVAPKRDVVTTDL